MRFTPIIFFLFTVTNLFAQQKQDTPSKKKTPFEFTAGLSWSGLDFQTYSDQKRAKPGANFKTIYAINNALKISAEYTLHFIHKDDPSWSNIHAYNLDLNAHICGYVAGTNLGFYTLFGASRLSWAGTFTGYRDEKNDGILLLPDQKFCKNKWMINLGMGFERPFKHFLYFGEVKFRFAKGIENVKVVINDVYYCVGIKVPLVLPVSKKKHRSTIPGDKYHWF